jgi:hypothetical protein
MIQESLKVNDYIFTHDLGLATAISLYCPLEAIDRTNPSKAEFIFKREPELDQIIENFWRKELQVDALTYFNQLKLIKARLYEFQQKTSIDYTIARKEVDK